jgi:hypothetical protein
VVKKLLQFYVGSQKTLDSTKGGLKVKLASTLTALFALVLGLTTSQVEAQQGPKTYSQTLCKQPLFYCYKVRNGNSWQTLNGEWRPEEIFVLQRINRMNISLQPGDGTCNS